MRRYLPVFLVSALLSAPAIREIAPVLETESLGVDVDDPSIWVHPTDPARSPIVGTIKRPKPQGGLAVYSLDGRIVQRIENLDRPNNVDILGDLCVTTERLARQLRVYRVGAEAPHLRQLGAIPVFTGETGESGAPMGIALYKRRTDGAVFAIVSRKTGPRAGYLWQYRIRVDGGVVSGEKVRALGAFSGSGEIEAVAVDQERELVYYSDEDCCIHAYHANPDDPDANREVARMGQSGFRGNREGIAIAGQYVVVTDQLAPRSEYHVYRRSDREEIAIWRGTAESTDGIEATAVALGSGFPQGVLVTMNNSRRNFHLYGLP